MADTNLPEPNPAPNGNAPQTLPSEPAPTPADAQPQGTPTPASPLDQLSDEYKNYLKGQGITDLSSPDAIVKVIEHGRSSQKIAADLKNELDKYTLLNPSNPQATPGSSSQPQPDGTQPTGQQPAAGLDQATAFLLTHQLATQFPHLKDDLVNGDFYKNMQSIGLAVTTTDGKPNIQSMLTYGKMVNDQRDLEAKLAEASKPGEGAIPNANPTTPAQPASDAPMTKQMAQAIIVQDPLGHPRAAEAKQFLTANP